MLCLEYVEKKDNKLIALYDPFCPRTEDIKKQMIYLYFLKSAIL